MELPLPVITIYTDGSCKSRMGGWASVLIWNGQQWNLCGSAYDTTSNRMELTAVIMALSKLTTRCIVHLYSDSKYVLDGIDYSKRWAKNTGRPKVRIFPILTCGSNYLICLRDMLYTVIGSKVMSEMCTMKYAIL